MLDATLVSLTSEDGCAKLREPFAQTLDNSVCCWPVRLRPHFFGDVQMQNSVLKSCVNSVITAILRERQSAGEYTRRPLRTHTVITVLQSRPHPHEIECVSIEADLDFFPPEAWQIEFKQILLAGIANIHRRKPVGVRDALGRYGQIIQGSWKRIPFIVGFLSIHF